MNAELRAISLVDLGEVLSEHTAWLAKDSHPLIEGIYAGQRLVLLGFISLSFLSDRAYLWLDTYPAASAHPLVVGRWARRLIPEALKRYPSIIGHCTRESSPWIRSLGAKITGYEFEITQ